jgi:hypothetical protein
MNKAVQRYRLGGFIMQRNKVILVLAVLIAAGAILTAVASTGTTLTWSKTFKVTAPQIAANIQIGNLTIIGYPVNITVALRIQTPSSGNITFKGNYTASIFWLNTTIYPCPCPSEWQEGQLQCPGKWLKGQWQQVFTFPSKTNVTLTTSWQMLTNATYTPTLVGQYKVVATFTTDSEVQTFTS